MSKVKSPWIVELKASFQEDDYLYLIMEYLPGGDFMNLLIKKDILTEEEARFYTAELILAIESIHKLDCIHRDIKPDNVLIDKTGHIKLSDFGLAKVSEKIFSQKQEIDDYKPNSHQKNYSCVGTAYYVAPEVLNKKGYGPEIDWWSVGVIFFEMLVGYAPFCSKETSEVCYKVLNWKKYLKIPSKIKISREAEDLIMKLINNSNERLGLRGSEEIKSHPFFKGIDWNNIRNTKAPFIPKLKNDYDNSYFETYKIKEPFYPPMKRRPKRKDIEYMGYTYKEDSYNDITLSNEFENSVKAITFLNQSKSNTNSEDVSNMENGGRNNTYNTVDRTDYNGLEKKINNISINIEDSNSIHNNDVKISSMTKKINIKSNNRKIDDKNEGKVNVINKIKISNTISYNSSNNINNKNKINKKINIYNNNNNLGINNSKICNTDRNKKIIKIEQNNSNNNQNPNCFKKNEILIELNNSIRSNKDNKLNVIQLPTKKIKEKANKKLIFPENGASNTSESGKYIIKKNLVKSSSN
jgi:serine/threonine protein kinase